MFVLKEQGTFARYFALFVILSSLIISSLIIFSFPSSFSFFLPAKTQNAITLKDLVTYSRQSSFIKEFPVPLAERGLKGITTDSQGNAWFYHSTNKSSTIIKLDVATNKFTQYNVKGNTTVDNFIINLAGGQILYDNSRNVIWFTDARINSIGKLDANNSSSNNTSSSKVELINVPTPKAGPMGIVMSPDRKTIWFAEITGDKVASLDIASNKVTEYPTGENTGPTFLTFDNKGILWVTMSYSHNVLRIEPWALVPGRTSFGMSYIMLPVHDTFSPFGISIVGESSATSVGATQRIFFSDHGSSRVVSSLGGDINSNPFQQSSSYVSYWTSPSQVYPTTLPGQIAKDKMQRNIYFPEHGGNRIAKINVESGEMTEYDIPTGPLSTTIFIALSDDGKKVWFTEWASNKVAYLDTTIPIPFNMKIDGNYNNNNASNSPITLEANESKTLEALLNLDKNASALTSPTASVLSLSEVEIAVIGMSDSGLRGITYTATPQRINMQQYPVNKSQITLSVEEDQARSGQYTAMIKASASEKKDQLLFVSLLYPIPLTLNVPTTALTSQPQQQQNSFQNNNNQKSTFPFILDEPLRSVIRILALPIAIGLIAFTIYGRIKRSKRRRQQQQEQQ
jgi:streptogramin lyase